MSSLLKSLLFAWCIVIISCTPKKDSSEPTKDQSPNIVLIVVDDLGYADMSCTGLAKDVKTPNIDKLATVSTRFTNAYATSPICSASRAGLITGAYQQRWGTFWYGGPGIRNQNYQTLPELLKPAGYTTGYIGKVHYGSHDYKLDNRNFPLNHGFEYFYGHTSARKHYLHHNKLAEDTFMLNKKKFKRAGQSLRQQPMWDGKEQKDTTGFSTTLFADKAKDYISNHKEEKFFLQLSFNAVHNFTHQLPKEYLDKHNLKGYHDWDPETEDYTEWYYAGRYPNNPEGRAQYLGQLYYLDQAIGEVLDHLEETGLSENTMVVLIGDNGGSTPIYANNGFLKGSKYTLYEGGIRVPIMISYPKSFKTGVISDNVISGMDILPTICKNTNIPIPNNIDGIDLTPLLTGVDNTIKHDTLIWDTGLEIAVRAGDWKMHIAKSMNAANYEKVDLELGDFLHNLKDDPSEQHNLKDERPEVMKQLQAVHQLWKEKIDKEIASLDRE